MQPISHFSLQTVDRASTGKGGESIGNQFIREGGEKIIAAFLEEAGLDRGAWRYLITERTKGSSGMPRFNPKRPVANGVICKIKTGGNDSAVEGLLVPPSLNSTGHVSAQTAYEKLVNAMMPDAEPEQLPAAPAEPTSPVMALLLKHQEKLRILSEAVPRMETLSIQRASVEGRIADHMLAVRSLQQELDKVAAEEKTILGVDPEALALLLE